MKLDLRRYWRIPVIGLAGAVLAFLGSFASSPVYAASTQLLVRGRDATFLTNTGQTLANQPGVVDASLARALGETQAALLSSRTVARMVVEELDLDRPDTSRPSLTGRAKSLVTGSIARAKAYVLHGSYSTPEPFDRAVEEVQAGLSARQLRESYVLELVAGAKTPALAVAIAGASADALISVSRERFRSDAESYRDLLGLQLTRAEADQAAAGERLRAFKEQNGIGNVDLEIDLGVESADQVRAEFRDAEVAIAAARAELASINASLAGIAPTDSSESRIETGRSTTRIEETNASGVFDQLRLARSLTESKLASETAKRNRLESVLAPDGAAPLTASQAELVQLQLQYDVAVESFKGLSERHLEAVANSETDVVEISRVDEPTLPSYPVSPKRYLYLGLGGIMGALAGLALTALAARRRGEPLFPWLATEQVPATVRAEGRLVGAVAPATVVASPGPWRSAAPPVATVPVPAPRSAPALVDLTLGGSVVRRQAGRFEVFTSVGAGAIARGAAARNGSSNGSDGRVAPGHEEANS